MLGCAIFESLLENVHGYILTSLLYTSSVSLVMHVFANYTHHITLYMHIGLFTL